MYFYNRPIVFLSSNINIYIDSKKYLNTKTAIIVRVLLD